MEFDERPIEKAFSLLGYHRLAKGTYVAQWSNEEVEHFLYLYLFAKVRDVLDVSVGLRNPLAAEFAARKHIEFHGPQMKQMMRFNKRTRCFCHQALVKFLSQEETSYLFLPKTSPEELTKNLVELVGQKVFPVIKPITHLKDLYYLLVNDREPFPWGYSAALRAGQAVWIGKKLGLTQNEVRRDLHPYEARISRWLAKGIKPSDQYIDMLFEDWNHISSCQVT